jgi:membrane fusion protein, multidrug efflux system
MSELVEEVEFRGTVVGPAVGLSRVGLKTSAIGLALVAAVLGTVAYGYYYWTTGQYLVSTDDAYVDTHSVLISPKVAGYISTVLVDDNQSVKVGQIIARIDPRDFDTAVAQASANVAAARASIDILTQEIAQQGLAVEQAQHSVTFDQAALEFSQQNSERYTQLAQTGSGAVQKAQQWESDLRQKQSALQRDNAGVAVAQKRIEVLQAQLGQARATLDLQQAAERQAKLNLSYTEITAPFNGIVGALTASVGQYVQPGTQLMALVPVHTAYITANFMETQLADVRAGQPVAIQVDTFAGKVVRGSVGSVAPASGQQFALMPPDNATGNFTKIVQRIPVKIELDWNDPMANQLRPGMSVEATIDTKPSGAVE